MRRVSFGIKHLLVITAVTALALAGYRLATGPSLDQRMVGAATKGHGHRFAWLVWLGADVDRGAGESGYGHTPLLDAAYQGNLNAVQLYVEHGAYVDYQEKDGFTAITYAARESHWDIVSFLARHHANFRLPDGYGLTAVDYAVRQGRDEMVALFHSKPTPLSRWRVSQRDWPLHVDDGQPLNRRYYLWHTWRITGQESCVLSLPALVDADGAEKTLKSGPIDFQFIDHGNRVRVVFADGRIETFAL
ncbi:ankyrin repeat domain-containing protein [Roseiconus nitratireducens]|uniref:Ankyrin repeat domain-containing protein n=1 Tax=Roseiconus nitratireducens TaxID=2605748 RepID=A0A5M6CV98_9BACT|nr:ankyrin repeat domain-containing protein [Roseiconus nitratireducens]KAA5539177.1 ankyrin repeat domain-containing protein [Roseiconus nitratireducens]